MKKVFLQLTTLVLAIFILLPGCATIFGHSSYPVSIDTNPSSANISITDKKGKEVFKGQSPAVVKLKGGAGYFSKAEYQVRLSKPGYNEQVVTVDYKLNGWYFGNLLIGGVLGMVVVDPLTGAMWKLDTPPIDVTLTKSNAVNVEPTLKIVDIASISQDMKAHLVRIK